MPATYSDLLTGPKPIDTLTEDCSTESKIYVVLKVCDNRSPTSLVANKSVAVQLADGVPKEKKADGSGLVTMVFTGDQTLPQKKVMVSGKDNGWSGSFNLNNSLRNKQVKVVLSGTFTMKVDIFVIRPWTSKTNFSMNNFKIPNTPVNISWTEPITGTTKKISTIYTSGTDNPFENKSMPCGQKVTVEGNIKEALASRIEIKINDNDFEETKATENTVDTVAYKHVEASGIKKAECTAEKNGTTVQVKIYYEFPKVFIAGEGTNFDYAVGLAERYVEPSRGIMWIYASQYDVTPIDSLPGSGYKGKDPLATTNRDKTWNQKTRVGNAIKKNLFIYPGPDRDDDDNPGRFNVMKSTHWDGLKTSHGEFDVVIFNNPHPGYGMHECELYGLKSSGSFSLKKGRYVSVHTIGYSVPKEEVCGVNDTRWLDILYYHLYNGRFDIQYAFVHNRLPVSETERGYSNSPTDTISYWEEDGTHNDDITIQDAFKYYSDSSKITVSDTDTEYYYNGKWEFRDYYTMHYQCVKDTIGLHSAVMRGYRQHGPSVLKSGGKLYIHGSQAYNNELTTDVEVDSTSVAGKMTNRGAWKASGKDRYFVWYPTNFTHTRFHPSLFPDGYKEMRHPPCNNATVYEYTKP
jgi:hypothetical protein